MEEKLLKISAAAEDVVDDLVRRAELVKRRHLQIADVVNGGNPLVRVFSKVVWHINYRGQPSGGSGLHHSSVLQNASIASAREVSLWRTLEPSLCFITRPAMASLRM